MLTPSDAMNRVDPSLGWHAKLMHFSGFLACLPNIGGDDIPEKNLISLADLIIFQRNCIVPEAIQAIKYWTALGKPVAIDLDDAYHILPPSNPAHNFWIKGAGENDNAETFRQLSNGVPMSKGQSLSLLEEGLRISSGLISPNRNLLNAWEFAIGRRKYYLQNYAESGWWTDLPPREELKAKDGLQDKIVIGWGGSISHLDSFLGSGVVEAVNRICRHYPNVVLKFCGNDERIPRFFDISQKQIHRQWGVPAEEWPKQVQSFDIGLAPLFGFYDQHRSWIKGMEYLLAGVPWVGTAPGGPNGTYADIMAMGQDWGYLVPNSVDAWEGALIKIIDNLEAEQAKAKALVPKAAQDVFFCDRNLDAFAGVYKRIIADFKKHGAGGKGLLPDVVHLR